MYDHLKAQMPSWVPAPAAVAGGLTGIVSVVLTNPVDVLKTHAQASPIEAKGSARGAVGAAATLLRENGVLFLARGMGARMLKIGIGQAVIFGVYDAARRSLVGGCP